MHPRNRSLGNGYIRNNSMGMGGICPGSRMSPEGSMRHREFYNSEYRNYNRDGFERGHRRNFRSQYSPSRKGDGFVEAGRLAVEFFVAKGILPPNALSGKWQNSDWKNQVADFLRVKARDVESVRPHADARTSDLSRFSNTADRGPGRKRYVDDNRRRPGRKRYVDDNRRRPGSFESYGNESNKELGRSGSFSDRPRDAFFLDGEDHTSSASKNRSQVVKYSDSGMQRSPRKEATPKSASIVVGESSIGKSKPIDAKTKAEGSILPSTEVSEQNSLRADVKLDNESSDMKISNVEGGEIRDQSNHGDEQHGDKEGKSLEPCVEKDNKEIKLDSELLRLSQSGNVPTETHSSLTKSSNIEPEHIIEVRDLNLAELPDKSLARAVNVPVDSSSTSELSKPALNSQNIGSGLKEESAANEEQGLASFNGQEVCKSLMMFSEKSIKQEIEGKEIVQGFQAGSTISNIGEKRTLEGYESWDGTKTPREMVPSAEESSDGCLDVSNSMGKRHSSEEPVISKREERSDQKRLMDMSLFPKGDVACIDNTEEKQLFPGSYNTCDLNLMEVSEFSGNHNNANSASVLPPVRDSGKQEMQVDTDLSLSNKTKASKRFSKCESNGKEIEVIDLEDDSVQEDKAFNHSDRRSDSIFTCLDNFQSNSHNNEVSDIQDGYGLMLSDFAGNEMPNCSAVPPDINSVHNDMDLHTGEGILEDDDSIGMPFGEIPISFFRALEQPPSQDS